MNKLIWMLALVGLGWLTPVLGQEQEVLRGELYFDTDAYTLTEAHQAQIVQWLDSLAQLDWDRLTVEAHTDSVGSFDYNAVLSARRAASVEAFVRAQGVPPEQVQLAFFGEARPQAKNATEETRRRNRRVELVATQPIELPEPEPVDLMALYRPLHTPKQRMQVSMRADTFIETEQGIILGIRRNSLLCESGDIYRGPIEVHVQEAMNIGDMLRNNLGTNTADGLLETAGMFEVSATGSCGELAVNPDAPITVLMPTTQPKEEMTLFVTDGQPGEEMNWDPHEGTALEQGNYYFGVYQAEVLRQYWQPMRRFVRYDLGWFERFRIRVGEVLTGKKGEWGRYVQDSISRTRRVFEERYGAIAANGLSNAVNPNRTYYTFNLPQFGWINCDRFLSIPPEEKVDFAVALPAHEQADVKLVFEDIKSIMSGRRDGDRVVFRNVPRGYRVKVVGLRIDDDHSGIDIRDAVIGAETLPAPEFEPVDLDGLMDRLTAL